MSHEPYTPYSLSAQEQERLRNKILEGRFGKPGEAFLTTRALAEQCHVSLVTAHNILVGLCESGYIELRGKHYYLCHSELLREKNNRDRILGVLVPQINNEFYSSLADAVVAAAEKNGYMVMLMSTSYSSASEKRCIQTLLDYGVRGIISCVPTKPDNETLYRSCPLPCVMLGHSMDRCTFSSVQVNSFSISGKVAQYLIEEGYRSFIYIGTKNMPMEKDVRFAAFQMELRQNGFALSAEDVLFMSADAKSDEEALAELLRRHSGPVGVFCFHDLLAAEVYRVCGQQELRIPEDVGVVGFDDLSIATSLDPSLSTVQYRIATMADMALSQLLARIASPNSPYDNYYIEPNLIIRKSAALSERTQNAF